MEFKQFLETWENYIYGTGGTGVVTLLGWQIWKKAQKKLDKNQSSRIGKLEKRMDELDVALEQNTKDDMDRYAALLKMGEDTIKSLKEFKEQFFELREGDQTRKIERLEQQIDKLTK